MTDRIKGLTVLLAKNTREDDADEIVRSIKMIRGVTGVKTHVADPGHYLAVAQAKADMRDKIMDIICDE